MMCVYTCVHFQFYTEIIINNKVIIYTYTSLLYILFVRQYNASGSNQVSCKHVPILPLYLFTCNLRELLVIITVLLVKVHVHLFIKDTLPYCTSITLYKGHLARYKVVVSPNGSLMYNNYLTSV